MLPAYAGMIPFGGTEAPRYARAPRVCGDDPLNWIYNNLKVPVLPAYAGMILVQCAPNGQGQ